jgi:hypothetical protein
VGIAATALSAAACITSQHVLVGKVRAPVLADHVRLYLEPPADPYVNIAIVVASSKYSFAITGEGKAEAVVRRLKAEAAKLGANGILLQDIADEPVGSIGTGVGTEFLGARGTVDLGFGAAGLLSEKFGRGVAIYLGPDPTPDK